MVMMVAFFCFPGLNFVIGEPRKSISISTARCCRKKVYVHWRSGAGINYNFAGFAEMLDLLVFPMVLMDFRKLYGKSWKLYGSGDGDHRNPLETLAKTEGLSCPLGIIRYVVLC